jgi:hypothetical protein
METIMTGRSPLSQDERRLRDAFWLALIGMMLVFAIATHVGLRIKETPDIPAVISAVAALVGTIVGLFVGHHLGSADKEQAFAARTRAEAARDKTEESNADTEAKLRMALARLQLEEPLKVLLKVSP